MSRLWKTLAPCALTAALAIPFSASPAHAATLETVIVREAPGSTGLIADAIAALGGTVTSTLAGVNTVVVQLPTGLAGTLAGVTGVLEVTTNIGLHLLGDVGNVLSGTYSSRFGADAALNGKSTLEDPGSLYGTARLVNADQVWNSGNTGQGIDVAVIDSGVSPVPGLDGANKIVYGPDLSFDSQASNLQYVDGFGHGTHMAGIIAAHDAGVTNVSGASPDAAVGIAPDARIVSVKVASADGSTDVSQVIAGINWVVEHQHDNGLNIRVLNLSFGTDGTQNYLLDPLTYAAEVAWRHGIVVVIAAGNDGVLAPLTNPAYDPFVIAVGASDHHATVARGDDTIADFSSRGTTTRRPDLAAPGRSIAGLRDPGSLIDTAYPSAVVGTRYFRGSGTSQATAVTSGAVALMLQARPWLTPDDVKQVLVRTAAPLASTGVALDRGVGRLDVAAANRALPLLSHQWSKAATGLGSIDAARGTSIQLFDDGVALTGEQDVQGQPWDASRWAADAMAGRTWNGGWWNGTEWAANAWATGTWGSGWTGRSWTGRSWTGHSWSGRSWTGRTWSDAVWTGHSWTGHSWTGRSWS
jgi:serine protease AprX